jgi:hypothetical protein
VFNRTHVWFAAFVLIVFAGGLATGVVIDRTLWHGGRPSFRGDRGPGGGPGRPGSSNSPGREAGKDGRTSGRGSEGPPTAAFVRDLDSLLDLTSDQETQVAAIIDASRPEMRVLQEEVSKKFADQQKALHDAIAKVLTPEQAKKFDNTSRGPFGFRWRGGGRGGR